MKELRYALRALRHNPTMTVVGTVTLALGIGANTAIFSVVQGVLLATLPYPAPDRIVRVWPQSVVNTEFLEHARERMPSMVDLALYGSATFAVSGGQRPEQIDGVKVTPSYFDVLGVAPSIGRTFTPEESRPGHADVAILSHGLWQSRFGGRTDVLGSEVLLDAKRHTIVGVMPATHAALDDAWRLWVPLEIDPESEEHWDWITYPLLGRLAPDATPARAKEELAVAISTYADVRKGYLTDPREEADITPLHEHLVGNLRTMFVVLFGSVGLVLLIACANVANLLLVRVTSQRRTLAVRSALGANGLRLVTRVMAESCLLSILGGLLGLVVATWTLRGLVGLLPDWMPRTANIAIDPAVLAFTLLVSLSAGALLGLLPGLRAARVDPQSALKCGGRGSTRALHRLNHTLVAVEIAVAVVLVMGAGLLVKSFHGLQQVDVGFATEGLLTLQLKPPAGVYSDDDARRVFFERVVERVREVPGVDSVAVISRLPMTPGDVGLAFRPAEGEPGAGMRSVSVRLVSPDLTTTLSIPLLRGRRLLESDRADSPAVGLINQALSRRLWGDEDPIGRRLVFETGDPWFTVVGVVGDIRQHRLDQATKPQVYRPLAQSSWEQRMALVARTQGDAEALAASVERAIWSVEPDVPIVGLATMDSVIARSLAGSRLLTLLFLLFGAVALTLGVIGVFGVTAYSAAERSHENGVRAALGATSGDILRITLRRTMTPVAAGLAVGAGASILLTRLLESFLFEVAPHDPIVLAVVVGLLAASAMLAGWLPARRATRIDPLVVLGTE